MSSEQSRSSGTFTSSTFFQWCHDNIVFLFVHVCAFGCMRREKRGGNTVQNLKRPRLLRRLTHLHLSRQHSRTPWHHFSHVCLFSFPSAWQHWGSGGNGGVRGGTVCAKDASLTVSVWEKWGQWGESQFSTRVDLFLHFSAQRLHTF